MRTVLILALAATALCPCLGAGDRVQEPAPAGGAPQARPGEAAAQELPARNPFAVSEAMRRGEAQPPEPAPPEPAPEPAPEAGPRVPEVRMLGVMVVGADRMALLWVPRTERSLAVREGEVHTLDLPPEDERRDDDSQADESTAVRVRIKQITERATVLEVGDLDKPVVVEVPWRPIAR